MATTTKEETSVKSTPVLKKRTSPDDLVSNESTVSGVNPLKKRTLPGDEPLTATKEKKGMSALAVIGTLAAVSAATIIGLSYAHKTDVIGKMSEGKMKDLLLKAKPATEWCHKACSMVKDKSVKYWDKLINIFKKKGA